MVSFVSIGKYAVAFLCIDKADIIADGSQAHMEELSQFISCNPFVLRIKVHQDFILPLQ